MLTSSTKQTRSRLLVLANFTTCLPPEIPRDIAFIPSILEHMQRWQVSWIRSKAGNNHRLQNRNQLQSAPVTQYGRQPSKVETRLLHCWALGKFHVKDSQSMPDQIMSDRRSKHAWSNCVLCIPFIVSGSPNEYWLHKCDACVIKTWRTPFKHRWPKLTNDWQVVKVSNHLQSNLKNR